MSISGFYTVNVQTPGQNVSGGTTTLAGAAGLSPGQSFLDFILAQLAAKTDKATQVAVSEAKDDRDEMLQSDNPLLAKKVKLDLAQLLAANPEIADQVKAYSLDDQSKLMETLSLNQKAFDDIIKPLLNADGTLSAENIEALQQENLKLLDSFLIDSEPGNDNSLLRLKNILDKIEKLAGEKGSPILVATNLTPQQITELQKQLDDMVTGKIDANEEAVLGIYIGLIQILPPHAQASGTGGHTIIISQQQQEQSNQLAAKLNKIAVGNDGQPSSEASPDEEGDLDFSQILKGASGKKAAAGVDGKILPQAAATLPGEQLPPSWPFPVNGGMFTTPDWEHSDTQVSLSIQGPLMNSIHNTVNAAAQTARAGMPHPGTQMVAATLQKAASDGESKNLILQLDPPELGRVEIQMSIGKDKSIKAVMIAEKPETMAMLQRDAHMLERALQNAGLDANGSSLSFELAQNGYDFNHNGGHDSHNGYGGRGKDASGEEQFIESTMTWFVDADTGHVRYNLLA